MKTLGLYIHIPFCVRKCDYCDFLSFGGRSQAGKDRYIEVLCKELTALGKEFEGRQLTSLYLGGGTPSVLSVKNFNQVMATVDENFILKTMQK